MEKELKVFIPQFDQYKDANEKLVTNRYETFYIDDEKLVVPVGIEFILPKGKERFYRPIKDYIAAKEREQSFTNMMKIALETATYED